MTETAQQYIQRITAYVEGKEPLTIQAATARVLAQLTGAVPAATLRTRPAPEKWSPAEIIAHLADAEIVTAYRLRWVLGAPGSAIAAYDQEAWATSGHYRARDPRQCVEQFRCVREANLALLESLTREQWQLYGVHSERGRETIEQTVRMTAGHDLGHVQQIRHILRPPEVG